MKKQKQSKKELLKKQLSKNQKMMIRGGDEGDGETIDPQGRGN